MARDVLKVKICQEVEGVYNYVDIDLFEFLNSDSKTEKLLVVSDIRLPKGKKRQLPNFSNVCMDSRIFDAGDWCINNNSVLPLGVSELICLHSISSIGDLIGVLPDSVQVIRVRNSISNNVLKKQDELEITQKFFEQYPNVVVYDERGQSLAQKISEKETQEAKKVIEPAKKQIKTNQKDVLLKTSDWFSADDFIAYTNKNGLLPNISDDNKKRYLQQARSKKSGLNIESQKMRREDGANVLCVKKQDVDKVVNYIRQMQQQKTKTLSETKKEPVKTAQKEINTPRTNNSEPVCWFNDKKIVKSEIKKYITNSVEGVLQKHIWLEVLKTIDKVNIDPTETDGDSVFYIDDKGRMRTIPTLDLKNAKCVCQGLKNNDRPRLVWAIQGCNLIAIRYFSDHLGRKERNEYEEYFRKLTKDDIPPQEEWKSIQDFEKELRKGGGKGDPSGGDSNDNRDEYDVETTENTNIDTNDLVNDDVFEVADVTTTTKKLFDNAKSDEFVIALRKNAKDEPETAQEKTTNTTASDGIIKEVELFPIKETKTSKTNSVEKINAETKWLDIASVAYSITQEYNLSKKKADRVVRGIKEASSAASKLKLATVLVGLLNEQKELEDKMHSLQQFNQTIKKMQEDLVKPNKK